MPDSPDDNTVPPHVRRALGPGMADLVGRTPLDQEAADQIETILSNDAVADVRGPMTAVALMNCLQRRITEAEAEIADYRALSAEIEAAAKGAA